MKWVVVSRAFINDWTICLRNFLKAILLQINQMNGTKINL